MTDYSDAIERAEQRREAQEEKSIAKAEAEREDPNQLKLAIEEKTSRIIEVTLPAYAKNSTWIVKVIGEREYIQIYIGESNLGIHYMHNIDDSVKRFFYGDFAPVDASEFIAVMNNFQKKFQEDIESLINLMP